MVKLPEEEVSSSKVPLGGKRPFQMDLEVKMKFLWQKGSAQLSELEEIADLATEFLYPFRRPNTRQIVMDWARQYLNLEFKLMCNRCDEVCTLHHQDEITAPER